MIKRIVELEVPADQASGAPFVLATEHKGSLSGEPGSRHNLINRPAGSIRGVGQHMLSSVRNKNQIACLQVLGGVIR